MPAPRLGDRFADFELPAAGRRTPRPADQRGRRVVRRIEAACRP